MSDVVIQCWTRESETLKCATNIADVFSLIYPQNIATPRNEFHVFALRPFNVSLAAEYIGWIFYRVVARFGVQFESKEKAEEEK